MQKDSAKQANRPLTWSEVLERLQTDPAYPATRRASHLSRVRMALKWDAAPTRAKAKSPVQRASKFLVQPFNYRTIDQLFDGLRAAELGLAQKTFSNARSVCKRVSDHYGVPRSIGASPFTVECKKLLAIVPSKWDRRALRPGMRYLSHVCKDPWSMTQGDAQHFEKALHAEFQVLRPRHLFAEFCRVWNKCQSVIPGWPVLIITRPPPRNKRLHDWSDYPELKAEIDRYLAGGRRLDKSDWDDDCDDDDFGGASLGPLADETLSNYHSSLGLIVWGLREAGIQPGDLKTLRDLCVPERFRLAMRELKARAGGVVNRTVRARLAALSRVAETKGVLTDDELKLVRRVRAKYEEAFRTFLKTHPDRDQATLDQLDDPSVMDALLALPTMTKKAVLAKRNRHTITSAYAIQRALILELWMCAPYRIGAFVSIELDQIMSMQLHSVERILLKKPKTQSANKRAPEHFLNADTVELLQLYLEEYRLLIIKHHRWPESAHLFPGRCGSAKSTSALREQITKFVRKNTSLKDWHPHCIRKVSPKITLDADPGAMEVARRTGGWASDCMLRNVYSQQVHRASQARYLDLLESRRLHSIRSLDKSSRKRRPQTVQRKSSGRSR